MSVTDFMRSNKGKLVLLSLFILGWILGTIYQSRKIEPLPAKSNSVRENSDKYDYINPLLFSDSSSKASNVLNPLKNNIQTDISAAISNHNIKRASVYYRDLNSGEWTGVNEDDLYAPASMLKITTMIAYFRLAEDNPAILSENLHYVPAEGVSQVYKPKMLSAGDYSVSTLIRQMIIESDNNAMTLLDNNHINDILTVYKELELPDPMESPEDFLSPKEYSRLLRILYNSTYLSRANSELALKTMSQSTFKDGLETSVPSVNTISHKFGEYSTLSKDGAIKKRELHDCGIVYYSEHPYIICVMTEGSNFSNMAETISNISKTVYDFVSNNR